MPRKVLLGCLCAAFFLAGCANVRERPQPSAPIPSASSTETTAKTKPTATRSVSKPRARTKAQPASSKPPAAEASASRAGLPALIGSGAAWTSPGFRTLAITRGDAVTRQPVPIFRQAGALATVRAALANSPAQPQAEFRNGVLTLKFAGGSNEEIASAVNKTLSVTGSRNLQVTLQP